MVYLSTNSGPPLFNPFNLPHHGATPENWCASQAWRWTSPLKDTVVEALRSKVTPANAGEALGKPWKRDCHQIFHCAKLPKSRQTQSLKFNLLYCPVDCCVNSAVEKINMFGTSCDICTNWQVVSTGWICTWSCAYARAVRSQVRLV